MGLDISVYVNVKEVDASEVELDEDGYPIDWNNYQKFYVNPHFYGRAEPIKDGSYYKIEYPSDEDAVDFGYSYGGYNNLRKQLSMVAGYDDINDIWDGTISEGAFVEVINFSDCEGIIGSVVSAKLAKDFAEYQSKADEQDEIFINFYNKLRKIFEHAGNKNGVVAFH
jgi:hypothetical protein